MAFLDWGVHGAQGRRPTMEDAHCHITNDDVLPYRIWAVLDGHGGPFASEFAADALGETVQRTLYDQGRDLEDDREVAEGISEAFESVDEKLCEALRQRGTCDGTTCIAAVVVGSKLCIANVGDSRAVCGMPDGSTREVSWDQTCDRADEATRVQAAGATVKRSAGGARINGELVPSRAMGDPEYKVGSRPHPVIATPEVAIMDMVESPPHFALLACDGLWDVCTNETAVAMVSRCLNKGKRAQKICEDLVKFAINEGSTDNVTALLVVFQQPSPRKSPSKERALRRSPSS